MTPQPFGLRDDPFAEGHDRRLVYPHRTHRESVDRLARAITQRAELVLLTGAAGSGKTTTLASVLMAAGRVTRADLAASATLDAGEVRRRIGEALDSDGVPAGDDLAARLAARDSHVPALVLAIDEAQELTEAVLGELSNLIGVQSGGRPALTVVLAGRAPLEARLDERPGLGSRIASRSKLEPMSPRETEAFIHHRVSVCGGPGAVFPRATCRAIHEHSRGIARGVRVLAGEALAQASVAGAEAVETAHVSAAIAKLDSAKASAGGARESREAAPAAAAKAVDEKAAMPTAAPAPAASAPAAAPARPVPAAAESPAPAPKPAAPAATPKPGPKPAKPAQAPSPPIAPAPAAAAHPPKPTDAPVAAAPKLAPQAPASDTPLPPLTPEEATYLAPSVEHTPEIDAWLARFHDPAGPPRIGARVAVDDSTTELAHPTPIDSSAGEGGDGEAGPPSPRVRPRRGRVVGRGPLRPSRYARRPSTIGWVVGAAAAFAIVSVVWLHRSSVLSQLAKIEHAGTRTTPASTPAEPATPAAPAPQEAATPVPESAPPLVVTTRAAVKTSRLTVTPLTPALPRSVPGTSVTRRNSEIASPSAVPRESEIVIPPVPDTSAPDSSPSEGATPANPPIVRHYRVIVGTYLVPDRAQEERDHVAGLTPFPCKVLKGHEDGAEVFRVLVGPFVTRGEAEAASEQLSATGGVSEARVVGWFGPKAPRE